MERWEKTRKPPLCPPGPKQVSTRPSGSRGGWQSTSLLTPSAVDLRSLAFNRRLLRFSSARWTLRLRRCPHLARFSTHRFSNASVEDGNTE